MRRNKSIVSSGVVSESGADSEFDHDSETCSNASRIHRSSFVSSYKLNKNVSNVLNQKDKLDLQLNELIEEDDIEEDIE